jgi:hypothetical protein
MTKDEWKKYHKDLDEAIDSKYLLCWQCNKLIDIGWRFYTIQLNQPSLCYAYYHADCFMNMAGKKYCFEFAECHKGNI